MRNQLTLSFALMTTFLACASTPLDRCDRVTMDPTQGVWVHLYSGWTEAPEFSGYTRWAPATLVAFDSDGKVSQVTGLLLGGEKGYSISPGDGVIISLGYWTKKGNNGSFEFFTVKVSETVARVGGSDIYREIEHSTMSWESATSLLIDGVAYEREPLIEIDYFRKLIDGIWSFHRTRLQQFLQRKG